MIIKQWILFLVVSAGWVLPVSPLYAVCDCQDAKEPVAVPSMSTIELSLIEAQVRQGQLHEAWEFLKQTDSIDLRIQHVRQVLDHYFELRDTWQTAETDIVRRHLEQLDEYKAAWEAKEDVSVEKVLRLLSRLQQEDPSRARQIENQPWIDELRRQALETSQQLVSKGFYSRAYLETLRWLQVLDPNNTELKEQGGQLLDMAQIERVLTPPACPRQESVYAQVKPEIFFMGLRVLDRNYIHSIDYAAMADCILHRSEMLGRVLFVPRKDYIYSADPNQVLLWQEAVTSFSRQADEKERWTRRDCRRLVEDLLDVNDATMKLPTGFMVFLFSSAALESLDPYTEIVWPAESSEFNKRMTGQFTGVGIRLASEKGQLTINGVLPDTPAQQSGRLRANDRIIAINDESADGMNIFCAVQKISGPEGTAVTLTIRRSDQEEDFDVKLVRQRITIPTVEGTGGKQYSQKSDSMTVYRVDADPGIGYVRIDQYGPRTAERLQSLLESLEADGLEGLILDLRSNSGGLLNASAKVSDLFLTNGDIVKTQPRRGTAMRFNADSHELLKNCPLVILINEGTASGAEITAGALASPENKRAVLVGNRTYGKGSFQEVEPLAFNGSRLKYTRGLYVLSGERKVPNHYEVEESGRTDWGIMPDVEVSIGPGQIQKIRKIQNKLRKAVRQEDSEGTIKAARDLAANDPQLAAGLVVLKTQLIAGGYDLALTEKTAVVSLNQDSAVDPNAL